MRVAPIWFGPEANPKTNWLSVEPTIENLEKSLRKVARLVEAYGDEYWPTFERLEKELKAKQNKDTRLNKYLTFDE